MRSTSRGAVSQSVRILYHGLHVMVTISLKKLGGSWLPVGVWMIRCCSSAPQHFRVRKSGGVNSEY